MRRTGESDNCLYVFDDVSGLRAEVFELLFDVRLLAYGFRILPVVDVLRDGVVDEFLDEGFPAFAYLSKGGLELRFPLRRLSAPSVIFFLCRVDDETDGFIIEIDAFELLLYLVGQRLLADIFLRAVCRPARFRASVVRVTLLYFGGDLESALAAYRQAPEEELSYRFPLHVSIRVKPFLRFVEELFRYDGIVHARVGLPVPLEESAVEGIGENAIHARPIEFLSRF